MERAGRARRVAVVVAPLTMLVVWWLGPPALEPAYLGMAMSAGVLAVGCLSGPSRRHEVGATNDQKPVVEPIDRAGPPVVISADQGGTVLAVPLTAPASPTWARFFGYSTPRPPRCYPALVQVDATCLTFVTTEEHAALWVE